MRPSHLACPLPAPHAVYLMVRERQLAYQIHAAALQGPAAWRMPAAAAAAAPSPLLARRGLPALCISVPQAATGIDAADTAVYVRSISVALPRAPCSSGSPPPPPAPVCKPAPVAVALAPLQRLATPPTRHEQPAKRSRLATPGSAVRAPPQPATGHLIAPAASCSCCSASTCSSSGRPPLPRPPAPLVLPMPPVPSSDHSCCSLPSAAPLSAARAPAAAYPSSSPLTQWLQRIKSMLSPRSQHHTPVYAY